MFTFLTLLLKPNANAQTVSFAGNFTYNNYQRNRVSSGNTTDNYTNNVTDIPGADTEFTSVQAPLSFDFRRTSETFYLKLSAYHVLKSNVKAYPWHSIIPARLYSVDLKHSARLTFKFFKLVILPLW